MTAALAMTSGNSNSTAMSLNTDMARASTADKISIGANANCARSKVGGVTSTTANKWSGFGQYEYNLSPRLFATIASKTAKSFSRASIYLGEESSHTLPASATFKQRLELYPGISGDKAVLAKFTAGLGVAISSTLNLSLGLVDSNTSKPPAGTKKNDVGLFTGINVEFDAV